MTAKSLNPRRSALGVGAVVACVAMLLALSACGTAAKQKSATKKPAEAGDAQEDRAGEPVRLSGQVDFDGWCAAAGDTAPAKDELAKLYDALCDGGEATQLFKTDLLTVVYAGEGEPRLKSIETMTSDKTTKETKYHFGVAIKLPISIEKHFTDVGPKAGDAAAQRQLAEANGATSATIEIRKKYTNDGDHHVRGWLIYSKIIKKVGPINVTTETEGRSDHWELKQGDQYMYSSYLTEGIQTVKKFDMLTAGVQAGDDAYLLTVVDVVVKSNFASEAEKQLKKTAVDTIKAMYNVAAEAE